MAYWTKVWDDVIIPAAVIKTIQSEGRDQDEFP
jgi:hypothetical protein